jgi:uncharacterized protein YebE (UPF0316 family)
MTAAVLLTCVLIFLARIADVSLGTLRTVTIMQGRRWLSFVLGFFEVLIWIVVVSRVIASVGEHPLYAVFYALGFATGNYVGLTIEQWWAPGRQVLRIFTRIGHEMSEALRERGYRVTRFDGHGRDGPVHSLYIETSRREIDRLVEQARELDAQCYYVVDDVRTASSAALEQQRRSGSGWRSMLKRK